ncbi:MAG: chlororespiratory reduction protein 7, partial [Microcystaceae cyanobacterium]
MPSLLMYQEEMFVILETDQEEQFLTPEELLD